MIFLGQQGAILVLDSKKRAVLRIRLHYPPDVDCMVKDLDAPRCITYTEARLYVGTADGIL